MNVDTRGDIPLTRDKRHSRMVVRDNQATGEYPSPL